MMRRLRQTKWQGLSVDWFTSDPHYYHKNVIEMCARPFANLEEMHAELIARWNRLVRDDDVVYILGDFVFGGTGKIKEILSQLRGEKRLIRGNHDLSKIKPHRFDMGFSEIHDQLILEEDSLVLNLCHYPYRGGGDHTEVERYFDLRLEDKGGVLIHGHVHNLWKTKFGVNGGLMINVGVDQHDFTPVSLEQIKTICKEAIDGKDSSLV